MANGLVLSGGGAKGDFEVGVVRYLYDSGFRPNVIAGSSVGAINAVKLAEGEGGLPGLEQLWWGLRTKDDMFLLEDWFHRQGNFVRDALNPLLFGDDGTGDGSGHINNPITTPIRIFSVLPLFSQIIGFFIGQKVGEAIDQLNTFIDTLDGKGPIANGHAPRSFFNLNPIRAKLQSSLSVDRLRQSGIALRLCVVRLEDGKTDFVDEQGRLLGEQGKVVDLFDAVLASAANPAVFPAVDLVSGGQSMGHYTDGGVGELLPIRAAIDAGAGSDGGQIYAVYVSSDLGKVAYTEASSPDRPELSVINLKNIAFRSIDIVSDNSFRKSLALAQHPNLKVIQSYVEIHGGETVDPGLIRINLAYGYLSAWLVKAAEGRDFLWLMLMLPTLTEIMKLRRAIWDLEEKLLGMQFIYMMPDQDGAPAPYLNHVAVNEFIQQMGLLRRMKAELANNIDAWVTGGGVTSTPYGGGLSPSPVPEQPIAWYAGWETHNIPADLAERAPGVFLPTPWEGYRWLEGDGSDSGLVLPAVEPAAITLRVQVNLPPGARQGQPLTFTIGTTDASAGIPVKSSLTVDGQPVQQTSGQPIDWTFHGDVHSVVASAPNYQPAGATFTVPQSTLRLDVTSDPPQAFPLDRGTTVRLTARVFDSMSGQELKDAALWVTPEAGAPLPFVEGQLSDPVTIGYRAAVIARRTDYSEASFALVNAKPKESKEGKDGKEGKESINKEAFKEHENQSPLGPPKEPDVAAMMELLNQRMSRVESLIGQSRTFITPAERPVVGPAKKPT